MAGGLVTKIRRRGAVPVPPYTLPGIPNTVVGRYDRWASGWMYPFPAGEFVFLTLTHLRENMGLTLTPVENVLLVLKPKENMNLILTPGDSKVDL